MKTYMGVTLVKATRCDSQGKEGYRVVCSDEVAIWSPREEFESKFLEIENDDKISESDIERIKSYDTVQKIGSKTTLVQSVLRTGYEEVETCACVKAELYDQEFGMEICLNRIKNRIWGNLGFVLQWAKYGLNKKQG